MVIYSDSKPFLRIPINQPVYWNDFVELLLFDMSSPSCSSSNLSLRIQLSVRVVSPFASTSWGQELTELT